MTVIVHQPGVNDAKYKAYKKKLSLLMNPMRSAWYDKRLN